MTKIVIEISNCQPCPFFKVASSYSTDGFDNMEQWHCAKSDRKIAGAVEWHEYNKTPVPDWCPIKIEL